MRLNETLFIDPVIDIISRRSSWRSYSSRQVDQATKEKVEAFIKGLAAPPFNSRTRFLIITAPDVKDGVKGTYGVIRGADTFIAGAVNDNPRALEDFGYQFEKIILFATSLGLGTCWLGGTFNRSRYAERLGLSEKEIIPAITPIGWPAGRRTVIDASFRFFAGSRKRRPFGELFFEKTFDRPLSWESAGKFADLLEMVRLGPSASNKQPWRFVLDGSSAHLILLRTRGYGGALSTDIQKIDMGIAMAHFELSAAEAGIKGRWVDKNPGISLPALAEYCVSWETSD